MSVARRRQRLPAIVLVVPFVLAASGWRSAAADSTPAPEPAPASAADATRLSLGPGMYLTPSYPGARSTRSVWVPFVDAEYAGRLYSSAADVIGVYAWKTSAVQAGAAVEYDLTERLSKDDERFRRLRDVHETPRFKLFASRTLSFITVDANGATDMAGRGQGTLAQANVWATVPFTPKFMVSVGPGFTWADARYMRTFFSISAAQAAVTPFAAYAARAGIVDWHWNGLETLEISSRWSVGASEYVARLHGTAVESPVTAARTQTTVLIWVAYKLK